MVLHHILTFISVAPWFDRSVEDTELNKFKEESVSFQCPAKGFPLNVEWKFQKSGEDNISSCISKCWAAVLMSPLKRLLDSPPAYKIAWFVIIWASIEEQG